ncbi:unknown protein [Microcystis aeruginosa NIES-843]|uniref:Uncharacterized protein n=1 Tax=Microcystis aeruginosa (strain NIES-843 / IAM M-2473) TaxID=449447 RepID=B0JR73_MICAN|nr:unknown protein [Microcystis aeruginosa NIES-843]
MGKTLHPTCPPRCRGGWGGHTLPPPKNFLPQTLTITDQGRSVLSVYFELESRADRFFSPLTRVLPNAG